MRLRIRGPSGTTSVNLPEDASVADLWDEIKRCTNLRAFDIKCGYPPQPLDLASLPGSILLTELGVSLNNEQLIIGAKEPPETTYSSSSGQGGHFQKEPAGSKDLGVTASKAIALNKQSPLTDVPELEMPERGALLVLRVMPDDNSCLFRAFGKAVLPGDDLTMHELRSLVAQAIQGDPETYPKVVLDQDPDNYCRWIQTEDAWGGAIEIGILAKHFDVEICSIDVKSLRIDTFSPPRPAKNRVILVYSGIHYDTIVQSPFRNAPPEYDQAIFSMDDESILIHARDLCGKLNAQHYYTDTGGMAILCEDCGVIVRGEAEAAEHAQRLGHYSMQEVKNVNSQG